MNKIKLEGRKTRHKKMLDRIAEIKARIQQKKDKIAKRKEQ